MENQVNDKDLDPEWIALILEAKRIGVTREEIIEFLGKTIISSQAK